MSEYRQSPTSGQWTILATERSRRPEDFVLPDEGNPRRGLPAHSDSCPFCRGGDVDSAVPSVERAGGDGRWTVRVVPNRYAYVGASEPPRDLPRGKFAAAAGYGHADVVVESPRHDWNPALASGEELAGVVLAWRDRFRQLQKDPAVKVVNVFRNHGPRAGASLVHPHSQIVSTSVVPPHISDQVRRAEEHWKAKGSCVYCDALAEELAQGERIVAEEGDFVVWCPFASRTPFETRVQSRRHEALFGDATDAECADFARALGLALRALHDALGDPDYNVILRSACLDQAGVPFYHWYAVVIPKLSRAAGMEIGTGIYVNTVAPEEAAKTLREAARRRNG